MGAGENRASIDGDVTCIFFGAAMDHDNFAGIHTAVGCGVGAREPRHDIERTRRALDRQGDVGAHLGVRVLFDVGIFHGGVMRREAAPGKEGIAWSGGRSRWSFNGRELPGCRL